MILGHVLAKIITNQELLEGINRSTITDGGHYSKKICRFSTSHIITTHHAGHNVLCLLPANRRRVISNSSTRHEVISGLSVALGHCSLEPLSSSDSRVRFNSNIITIDHTKCSLLALDEITLPQSIKLSLTDLTIFTEVGSNRHKEVNHLDSGQPVSLKLTSIQHCCGAISCLSRSVIYDVPTEEGVSGVKSSLTACLYSHSYLRRQTTVGQDKFKFIIIQGFSNIISFSALLSFIAKHTDPGGRLFSSAKSTAELLNTRGYSSSGERKCHTKPCTHCSSEGGIFCSQT